MRLVQAVLLKTTGSKETLGAQRASELFLMQFVMLFFLIQTAKDRGAALTFVHFGGRVEVYWHKHASSALFAHNNPRGGGRGGVRGFRTGI